jgi:hypothetical protein
MGVDIKSDLSKLRGLGGAVQGAVGLQLRHIALDLLGQGVTRAPVDEGTLRGSGSAHFAGERIAGDGADAADGGEGTDESSAMVVFNSVYAEAQHERTDFVHPKGGEAKYLERPLEENRARYEAALLEAVKKETA